MQTPPPANPVVEPPPQTAPPVATEEMRKFADDLSLLQTRARSILASVDTLRLSLQAAGNNLGGDIQSAADRMNHYLEEASTLLQAKDVARARVAADKAEHELEKLEALFNR